MVPLHALSEGLGPSRMPSLPPRGRYAAGLCPAGPGPPPGRGLGPRLGPAHHLPGQGAPQGRRRFPTKLPGRGGGGPVPPGPPAPAQTRPGRGPRRLRPSPAPQRRRDRDFFPARLLARILRHGHRRILPHSPPPPSGEFCTADARQIVPAVCLPPAPCLSRRPQPGLGPRPRRPPPLRQPPATRQRRSAAEGRRTAAE